MTVRLVVDLATDRIIWFTSDDTLPLSTDERSAYAEYSGELPASLTVLNCWNFRYLNGTIRSSEDRAKAVAPPSLLATNKATIEKEIRTMVSACIKEITGVTDVGSLICRQVKLDRARGVVCGTGSGEWMQAVMARTGHETEMEAAHFVLHQEAEALEKLRALDTLKGKALRAIANAKTNDDVFVARSEFFDSLNIIDPDPVDFA